MQMLLRIVWGVLLSVAGLAWAGGRPLPAPAAPPDTAQARLQQQLAAHPQPDTVRLNLLANLTDVLRARDVRSARPALLDAVALARRLRNRDLLAETLLSLADYHIALAQYDSAKACLYESNREFNRVGDPGGEMRCLGRLGRIADQQGQYAASLRYNFRALAQPLISNTRRFHTSIKIQLGTTYAQVGEYAQARAYLLDAQCIAERYDYPDRLNLTLGQLGEISQQQRRWAAAQFYYAQSMVVSARIHDLPTELAMQLNLARLAAAQGQYARAAALGRRTLAGVRAAHFELLAPLAQALLARLALQAGQADTAIAYAKQGLHASERLHLLTGVREASAVLVDAYTQRRAYQPALAALRQYTAVNDTLSGETVRRRAALLQFGQRQREQQAQITQLTQQNRLQAQTQELTRLRSQRQLISLSALMLLALLLAGGLLWQYRRRQRQREEALRQRLAADLHDDVGNLLTQVSMEADLLRSTPATTPEQLLPRLQRLSDTSRQAGRQMADVVWGLHASSQTLPELLPRLRDHAHEILLPTGVAVDFAVSPEAAGLHPEAAVCQQLYLIYKEALHNVVKHARHATQVTIGLSYEGHRLCLRVHDDGALAAPPPLYPHGHGLRNMRRRAEAIGGTLQLETGGAGFGVVACLPLSGAARRG